MPFLRLGLIYLAETESASFWLQVLADLQARGVKDILIASIDNLAGFKEAINALSKNRCSALHCPPDQELLKICKLETV